MLNFRKTNILFVFILGLVIIADLSFKIHWSIYVLVVLAFFSIQFYGCYFINSGFHIKTYCSKETKDKEIAITFDDGPDEKLTSKILDILREFRTPSVFFCIGKKIPGNENLIKRMDDEGHIIGNHSFSHTFWFDLFSASQMTDDLQATENKIQSVMQKQPKLFRPPYGVTNPNLRKATTKLNYFSIGWNIRSMDTVLNNEDKIFKRIISKIKPGAILLLHDTIPQTESMLPKLLIWLGENNYKVVRADKLLNLEPYA